MPMTKDEMREKVIEMEQAADDAKAAIEAEAGAGRAVRSAVLRLHDRAREARQAVEVGGNDSALSELLEQAEEAADEAWDAAEGDGALSEGVKAVIREAHDAAKEARDSF